MLIANDFQSMEPTCLSVVRWLHPKILKLATPILLKCFFGRRSKWIYSSHYVYTQGWQEDKSANGKSLKALMSYSWKAWQHFTFLRIRFVYSLCENTRL